MKSKNVAFLLSFILPGAGLAYLGRWRRAGLNLAGALALGLLLALVLPASTFDAIARFIAIGIGSGSGAWAMYTAETMNAKARAASSLDEVADEARLS